MAHDPLFWLYAEIRILRKRIAALEKPIAPSPVTLSLDTLVSEDVDSAMKELDEELAGANSPLNTAMNLDNENDENGNDEIHAVPPAELVLSAETFDDDDVRSLDKRVSLLDEWKTDVDEKFFLIDKWKADVELVNTETMKKVLEVIKEFNDCMEMTNNHRREISRVQAKLDDAMDSIGELCHNHHGLQNEMDDIRDNMDELAKGFARGKGVKGRLRQPG